MHPPSGISRKTKVWFLFQGPSKWNPILLHLQEGGCQYIRACKILEKNHWFRDEKKLKRKTFHELGVDVVSSVNLTYETIRSLLMYFFYENKIKQEHFLYNIIFLLTIATPLLISLTARLELMNKENDDVKFDDRSHKVFTYNCRFIDKHKRIKKEIRTECIRDSGWTLVKVAIWVYLGLFWPLLKHAIYFEVVWLLA